MALGTVRLPRKSGLKFTVSLYFAILRETFCEPDFTPHSFVISSTTIFPFFQMLLMLKLSVVSCSLGREIIFICHYFRNEYWTHDVKDLRRFKELTFQIWKRGEASLHCSQFSEGRCHLDKVGERFSLCMWPRREK